MKPPATFIFSVVLFCFVCFVSFDAFQMWGVVAVFAMWLVRGRGAVLRLCVCCAVRCPSAAAAVPASASACISLPRPRNQACTHRVAVERPGVQGRQQVRDKLALAVAAVERHRDGGLDKQRMQPRLCELGEAVFCCLLFALVRFVFVFGRLFGSSFWAILRCCFGWCSWVFCQVLLKWSFEWCWGGCWRLFVAQTASSPHARSIQDLQIHRTIYIQI